MSNNMFGPTGGAASGYVMNTVTKSADYTATLTDEVIIFTSAQTLTLPAAATATNKVYTVIYRGPNSTSGFLTIDGNSSDTINGNLTYSLINKNDAVRIECDGTSWYVCEAYLPQLDLASGANLLDYDSITANGGVGAWVAYADAAGTSPVDGTGGSPVVTVTRTASSPLKGNASFVFTKDGSNRQGNGISCDFVMPFCYSTTVQTIEFDYVINSGTFVAGSDSTTSDVTVWIYDSTNSSLIPVTPYKLLSSSTTLPGHFRGTFQVGSLSTVGATYRLILHCQSTSASAYTIELDNFRVGPQPSTYGVPSTDWATYTPTSAFTNTTHTAKWRRVGDSVELEYYGVCTGTPASATFDFTLPSGLTIDTTKIPDGGSAGLGAYGVILIHDVSAGTRYAGNVVYGSTTTLRATSASTTTSVTELSPMTFAVGDHIYVRAVLPITGWSSNVLMSNDTDTRVVAAIYGGAAANATANNPIKFPTKVQDTHNAYSVSTGQFTAPVSGYYRVSINIQCNMTTGNGFYVSLNGASAAATTSPYISWQPSANFPATGSQDVYALAGQTIDIRPTANVTATNAVDTLSISRLSGPATVAASEKCIALITGDPASATSGNPIIVPTASYDSHGAYSVSTGRYTCPKAGVIKVYGALQSASSATTLTIYKNAVSTSLAGNLDSNGEATFNSAIQVLAGDIVDLRPGGTVDATNMTLNFELL